MKFRRLSNDQSARLAVATCWVTEILVHTIEVFRVSFALEDMLKARLIQPVGEIAKPVANRMRLFFSGPQVKQLAIRHNRY